MLLNRLTRLDRAHITLSRMEFEKFNLNLTRDEHSQGWDKPRREWKFSRRSTSPTTWSPRMAWVGSIAVRAKEPLRGRDERSVVTDFTSDASIQTHRGGLQSVLSESSLSSAIALVTKPRRSRPTSESIETIVLYRSPSVKLKSKVSSNSRIKQRWFPVSSAVS